MKNATSRLNESHPSIQRLTGRDQAFPHIEYRLRARPMSDNNRFPKPWFVVENEGSFVVEDAAGTVLSRIPFVIEGQRSAPSSMSRDEARRIAETMVKMTDVLMPTRQG